MMTFFFIFVAAMAVWMLWPASRNDGAASRAHLQDTEVRRVFRASDLDEFRPITTQAIAVKAYRMLLERHGYARNAPGLLNETVRDFRESLRCHLGELVSTIEAYREELSSLREIVADWESGLSEDDADSAVVVPVPERLQQHQARAKRLRCELGALLDERADLRKDLAELVAAKANHTLFLSPDPIKRQRDESPYL